MNIRDKLLFQFSLFVFLILFVFSIAILYFSSDYRQNDFYSRLRDKAKTSAQLLLNVKEVDKELLKIIDKNTQALFKEMIFIYDNEDELLYSNVPDSIPSMNEILLAKLKDGDEMQINEGEREILGVTYEFKGSKYNIIISAFDKYGLSKIKNLKIILIVAFITSLLTSILFGFIFAGRALAPISNIIAQVNNIKANNLNQRLDEGNKKDEIAQLSITFNQMLQRIEDAFILQRDFVSHAAHELRTPFTVLLTEVDYTLMKERDQQYYKDVLHGLSNEIKKLSKLSNGLLDMARIDLDKSAFNYKDIRMDELLIETCNNLLTMRKDYILNIDFESLPENEKQLKILGNEHLLSIAISNLMDNACKFSDSKSVFISFENSGNQLYVFFKDVGIGISKEELISIFEPFFRGKNSSYSSGYGIGLALTNKIIHLHGGTISVNSEIGKGSIFKIALPLIP